MLTRGCRSPFGKLSHDFIALQSKSGEEGEERCGASGKADNDACWLQHDPPDVLAHGIRIVPRRLPMDKGMNSLDDVPGRL